LIHHLAIDMHPEPQMIIVVASQVSLADQTKTSPHGSGQNPQNEAEPGITLGVCSLQQ